MKDSRFTSEQREAIKAPSPAAITAGAGSGKTRVLVERFLEEAHRCGSVRRVVAITFTRKAAAEMRGRIRERLLDHLDEGGKDAPQWRALWEELPFARIGTIDQFCAGLLREHALQIGIDPDFSISDESESKDREARLLDELLADLDAPAGLRASTDTSLREVYRRLLSYWSRYQLRKILLSWGGPPRPLVSQWARGGPAPSLGNLPVVLEREKRAEESSRCALLHRAMGDNLFPSLLRAKKLLEEAVPAASKRSNKWGENREKVLSLLENLSGDPSEKNRVENLPKLAALCGAAAPSDAPTQAWDEDIWEKFREGWKLLRYWLSHVSLSAEETEEFVPESEVAADLARLFLAWRERIGKSQAREGWLSFGDLQEKALSLLEDESALSRIRDGMAALLVDEAQDTSPGQWALIRRLYGEKGEGPRLFVVGDEKQSIYAFRGADVSLFAKAQEDFGKTPKSLRGNFRSRPGLLSFFGKLFGTVFPEIRPAPFEARWEALEPGNGKLPGGRVEWLRLSPEEDSESVQAEARACALLLRRCKEEGFKVWEEKEGAVLERPFEWRDGAILFQRRLNLSVFEEALRHEGIPCRIHQGKDFFLQPEVIDLVNLTAFLADPTGDLPLLAVLRSPLFALSDEVLLWIAEHPGRTLWRRLSVAALPELERKERTKTPCWISEEERERVRFTKGALLRWRELSGRVPPSEILSEVLLATSFWTTAQMDKSRPQAAPNVERLLALARAEEARGLLTLSELAEKWIAHIEDERPEEEASPEEEGPVADAVSLLTVHAAKGLEFPVAVLPELSASFYREGPRLRFARAEGLHLGSGVLFGGKIRRRSEPGEAAPSLLHQLLDLRERREQRAEKARLFYVACTRARDALFLVSTSGAPEEQKDKGPTWRLWLEAALGEPEDGTRPLAGGGELRITKEAPKPGEKPPAPPPPDFSKWLKEKGEAKIQAELEKRLAPLPAPAAPLFLSPSLLEHYEHCPLRYRYKNVLQIPEGDPFPTVSQGAAAGRLRGKLFHKAIEKSTEALPPRELASALAAEAGELLRDEDVLPPEGLDPAALAGEVAEEVFRFSKSTLFKALSSSREVLRELPFQWRLGEGEGGKPLFLSGRIDLLFRHPETGRLTVVDFKTDRRGEKPRLEQAREKGYDGQVRRYALAVRALSGEPEVKGALYWAAEGFYQEIPTAPSDLDAERARLLEAGRVLLRGEFPPTEDEKKCRECGYYKYRVCERWEVDPVTGEGAAP